MKVPFVFFMLTVFSANATIFPTEKSPIELDETKFMVRTIRENTTVFYRQENEECNNVKFRDYYFVTPGKVDLPLSYGDEPEKAPVSEWFCLFVGDDYDVGYNPGVKEKLLFDKKNKVWKLTENKNITDVHKDTLYIPLKIYNIESKNAKGYLAIDENITRYDRSRFSDDNLKKKFRFCMIHDGSALCGDGSLIRNIDGKEVDFTPYLLKSLESMELAVKE